MKVGKKELLYALLMGIAVVLGFLKTMVFGAYLSPKLMGYYSITITLAGYGTFLQLGLMSGLSRELPIALGSEKKKYYSGLVGETTMAIITIQLIGFMIYCIILGNITFKDVSVRNAFFFAGPLVIASSLGAMVMLRLRSEQRILSFSSTELIKALGVLLLGIIAIRYMSYKGAIFAISFINFGSFIIVSKTILKPVDYFYFKLQDIIYLMRIGFPMMLAGVLLKIQMSMDRLFLIKNVLPAEIGIYQIGIIPLTMGIVISSIANQYVGPKLLFRYGQGKSLKYIFNKSLMVSLFIIGVMFLFWPVFLSLISFFINRWLPDYHSSLPLLSIFYFGAIFTAASITNPPVLALNRQILSLYQSAIIVSICFIGFLIVDHHNMPIKWYAYVNVAGQILNFFAMTGISYYLVYVQKRQSQAKFSL